MKTTVKCLLWVGIIVAQIAALSTIAVYDRAVAISATDGSQLSGHDLIISGLSITNNSLDYIQVFNSDDRPFKLSGWRLVAGTTSGEKYFDILPINNDGWIEPDTHIVVSVAGRVGNASAAFTELNIPLAKDTAGRFQLGLVPPSDMAARVEMEFLKPSSTLRENMPWTRTLTSTGYGESYIDSQEYERLYRVVDSTTAKGYELFDNGLYVPPPSFDGEIKEIYSYASECSPFDQSVTCGDYVKFKYTGNPDNLDMYVLRSDSNSSSRTTTNTFTLSQATTHDNQHYLVYLDDSKKPLSLNNTSGHVWFEDKYGIRVFENSLRSYVDGSSDHQGWSYIAHDNDWVWTIDPQPFYDNSFKLPEVEPTVIKACPAGQYRNLDTGRCRSLEEAINILAVCDEGYERNPLTNRCRKIATLSVASLTPCKEGQIRNPETNRCRSIASEVADLIPCDEGLERNPETNRCRKVAGASTVAASNSVSNPSADEGLNINPYAAAVAILAVGLAYAGYEWRGEFISGYRRLIGIFSKK